jgi:glycosyltransferase involved in cell wall biosynthesis
MPTITVLMPVHNQAELLQISLASVLSQTVADLEVLVAGDGCTDHSADVVAACPDPRVRWLGFPKAPGYGYANRARALAEAQSDLVAYLAPDDLWMPDHLETLLTELECHRLDFVFSRPIIVSPDGSWSPHHFPFDIAAARTRVPVWPRLYFLSPSQVLHTRALLERAGTWDGRIQRFGDVDLWLRWWAAGARMRFVPHPTMLRLPSLAFRHTSPADQATLQAKLWSALRDGRFDPWRCRLPPSYRVLCWCRDFSALARARGPAFIRARLSRWRARPV